jgi:hypothetical protein
MKRSSNFGESWRFAGAEHRKSNGAKTLEGVRVLYAYQTLIAQRLAGEDLRDHRQNEGATPAPPPPGTPTTLTMHSSKSRLQSLTFIRPYHPRYGSQQGTVYLHKNQVLSTE